MFNIAPVRVKTRSASAASTLAGGALADIYIFISYMYDMRAEDISYQISVHTVGKNKT